MKICAVTMVHNEPINLPIWLSYYGRELGAQNLFVIDHGSTDGTRELVETLPNRLLLERTAFDDEQRLRLIKGLVAGLLAYHDVCIYADCDEILVADPARFAGLREFVAASDAPCYYATGLNLWHIHEIEPGYDPAKPVLGQRSVVRFNKAECKPLIARTLPDWNGGFHTSQFPPALHEDLYLIHLKYMDMDLAFQRLAYTREMPWSDKAIESGQGRHQREPDEDLLKGFATMQRVVTRNRLASFDFADERRVMLEQSKQTAGGRWARKMDLPPKIARLPDRFRGLF